VFLCIIAHRGRVFHTYAGEVTFSHLLFVSFSMAYMAFPQAKEYLPHVICMNEAFFPL
jgi:hypothetical protein